MPGPKSAASTIRQGQDAAVILVSRDLAPWLADKKFLADLITATGLATACPERRTLSVLSAVVDEVPYYSSKKNDFGSSQGISVLLGKGDFLIPTLWFSEKSQGITPRASLEFRTWKAAWATKLTLPLANTLFTTGQPHTLFATRWAATGEPGPVLRDSVKRTQATIGLPPSVELHDPKSTLRVNLTPVTPPRKILASLGNILSKIEIDGHPAPPSQELESNIPKLLERRRSSLPPDHPPAPVGVWALTIPKDLLRAYPIMESSDSYHPRRLARLRGTDFDWDLLMSRGCQLSKVCEYIPSQGPPGYPRAHHLTHLCEQVSGGGGWGAKKGLLSLDPQTTLATDEDQDMQRFMDSFDQRESSSDEKFVQFFVESFAKAADPQPKAPAQSDGTTSVIGTAGSTFRHGRPEAFETASGLFGAVSETDLFLERRPFWRGPTLPPFKVNASRSHFISTPPFPTASALTSPQGGGHSWHGSPTPKLPWRHPRAWVRGRTEENGEGRQRRRG
jgi:hypothetical protein